MIYGLYLTADNAKPASVVFAVLMVLGFFGDILFELFTKYFISRSHMLLEAMKADFEDATKPVRSVGNFFKKITGHETIEDDPSKERQFLNERVGQVRVEQFFVLFFDLCVWGRVVRFANGFAPFCFAPTFDFRWILRFMRMHEHFDCKNLSKTSFSYLYLCV